MQNKFTIKSRQIKILKKEILSSGLILEDILNDAEKLYNDNPYHNFLHALVVTNYVLRLNKSKFSPIELISLAIAAIFHDTGHTGHAMELDEFLSLDNFRNVMDKYPDFLIDDSICRAAIIGTVFKNRAKNKNKYARILADCDIGNIGEGLAEFLYYGLFLSLEFDIEIETFLSSIEKKYFLYLININKQIIITEEVREILPNSLKTIKEFYKISLDKKIEMFKILRGEDISLKEFKERFFNS